MKALSKLPFVLFLFVIIFATSCVKEDDISYAEKYYDQKQFKCKINGEKWTTRWPGGLLPFTWHYELSVKFDPKNGNLYMTAWYRPEESDGVGGQDEYFDFDFDGLKLGDNNLNDLCSECTIFTTQKPYTTFQLDPNSNNNFHISKIDTMNKKIKGSFYFRGYDEESMKEVDVTNGEFDVFYQEY